MNYNSTWVPLQETLRERLRNLLLHYSASEVHSTLMQIFREDYDFYKTLFASTPVTPPSTPSTTPPPETAPAPPPTPPPAPRPAPPKKDSKLRADVKVCVIKGPVASDTIESLKVDSLPDAPQALHPQPKKTKEQMKTEQTEKVSLKRQELEGLGVDPLTLLTKENLTQWVDVKGLTYSQVAREYVGLSEKVIGEYAKKFGIVSSISKKRAAILANKK
jgi:hypothetical protein